MKKWNFYIGAAVSSWLLTLMIIAGELFSPFKDILKNAFTHHWIGKIIITMIAFFAVAYFMRNKKSIAGYRDDKAAWYSVVGSLAVIFAFFALELFL